MSAHASGRSAHVTSGAPPVERSATRLLRPAERIAAGAIQGALVWAVYAVVEQALSVWWPLLDGWGAAPTAEVRRAILTLLGSFVALGGAAGALAASVAELWGGWRGARSAGTPDRVRALATAT